jgi:hypothetical protein
VKPTETEQRLRETLDALAARVTPDEGAYRKVAATWRWRELRRRLLALFLATVIILVAVVLGLWLLNRVAEQQPVVFQGPPVAAHRLPPELGAHTALIKEV